jgi:hypothetical protein
MHINRATSRQLLTALGILFAGPAFGWWTFGPYTEHEDLTGKAIDIALARWPEMTSELEQYRSDIVDGSHNEDFDEDGYNGAYVDYSGYSAARPDAYWPTATRPLNALEWTRDAYNPYCWDSALVYQGRNPGLAYLALGHILHNLEDLFVPAHSFIGPHGSGTSGLVENHSWPLYFDNFEQYDEVTENELGRADPNRIPEQRFSPETLMVRAAVFATSDQESLGYYPSQYFAPPDFRGDWGKYRPYPSGGYPCGNDRIDNDLANTWSLFIVPRCVEHCAGLIRTFFELTHTGVNASEPAPVLTASPTVEPSLFRAGTSIRVTSRAAFRDIVILDAAGRRVNRLPNPGAVNSVTWNGCDQAGSPVPPGTYFVVLAAPGGATVRRVVRIP